MHLLETYALSTASKINKPFIIKKYFPLPFEKYITIQNSSGMPGKCYDYFQEVVNNLLPILEKENIKIVQIGSKDDKQLVNVINYQGQTNINQVAYIIDNSMLHIGNDSFAIHMASAFGVPLIGLYSVSSPEIAGPFWKNSNQTCLTPNNWKPSFNPNDNPKRINEIKIEDIVKSAEKLLFNTQSFKQKIHFIGDKFTHAIIECYPDQAIPQNFFPNQMANIRLDYKKIENIEPLIYNLSTRPCCLVINSPINLDVFLAYRQNLSMIIYDITEGVDPKFVEYLNNLLLKHALVFKKTDTNKKQLAERKIEILDLPNIIEEITINSKFENFDNNFYYKTNKVVMANNQIYASKAGVEENKPVTLNGLTVEQKIGDINNLNLLKEEIDHFMIFEK